MIRPSTTNVSANACAGAPFANVDGPAFATSANFSDLCLMMSHRPKTSSPRTLRISGRFSSRTISGVLLEGSHGNSSVEGVIRGSGGNRTPSAGKDLVYSQVQPTNICLRPIAFDELDANERKPSDSHTMPRWGTHWVATRLAPCAIQLPRAEGRGLEPQAPFLLALTLLSKQVRSHDRFSFQYDAADEGVGDCLRIGSGEPTLPRPRGFPRSGRRNVPRSPAPARSRRRTPLPWDGYGYDVVARAFGSVARRVPGKP
jgi:hypothetical protein